MYQISIRFDNEVIKKIKEIALREERSIAYTVNKLLKKQLLTENLVGEYIEKQ